jgi:copper chaperone
MSTRHLHIAIDGMSCDGCVRSVTKVLQRLPGLAVGEVRVGAAEVDVEDGQASDEQVRAAIEKAGFTVRALSA